MKNHVPGFGYFDPVFTAFLMVSISVSAGSEVSTPRNFNEPCEHDSQCGEDDITGSQLACINKICSCDPDQSVYASVRSYVVVVDDDNNVEKQLCAPLATRNCFNGSCAPGSKCSAPYYGNGKYLRGRNDWTRSAVCQCTDIERRSPTNIQCLSVYGQPCNSTHSCIEGLACDKEGVCRCPPPQQYSIKRKSCFSSLGQTCRSDGECVTNGECRDDTCVCKPSYSRISESQCVGHFGSACVTDTDCDQRENKLVCSKSNICDCQPSLNMSSTTGRCSLLFGTACNGSVPCYDTLECVANQCKCPVKSQIFEEKQGRCMETVAGSCDNTGAGCESSAGTNIDDLNKEGTTSPQDGFNITIYMYLAFGVAAFAVLIGLGFAGYYRFKLGRAEVLLNELTAEDIKEFRDGIPQRKSSNYESGEADAAFTAYALPYNNVYEFPVEKLHFGDKLGSGAFGTVFKAEAEDLFEGEEKTTVAVKTVSPNVEIFYLKALLKELKLMMYIGSHENVVQLLGACTLNLKDRVVFAIVEYCEFGNVLDFLHSNRQEFIANLTSADRSESENAYVQVPVGAGERAEVEVLRTLKKQEPHQDFEIVNLDNSIPLIMTSLISWCHDVASGMEYLASRQVVHSDLAARNVLLSTGNIAKVADFGLSRKLYQDQNYVKSTRCPLPLKWMALESVSRMEFSCASDVWSFGVFCWEVFTLGDVPYPGETVDIEFVSKLQEGYRLQKPTYAGDSMYGKMQECWNLEPSARPTFGDIANFFSSLYASCNQGNLYTETWQ